MTVQAVVSGHGRVHVVTRTQSGELLHQSWLPSDQPEQIGEWRPLSAPGSTDRPLAVVPAITTSMKTTLAQEDVTISNPFRSHA